MLIASERVRAATATSRSGSVSPHFKSMLVPIWKWHPKLSASEEALLNEEEKEEEEHRLSFVTTATFGSIDSQRDLLRRKRTAIKSLDYRSPKLTIEQLRASHLRARTNTFMSTTVPHFINPETVVAPPLSKKHFSGTYTNRTTSAGQLTDFSFLKFPATYRDRQVPVVTRPIKPVAPPPVLLADGSVTQVPPVPTSPQLEPFNQYRFANGDTYDGQIIVPEDNAVVRCGVGQYKKADGTVFGGEWKDKLSGRPCWMALPGQLVKYKGQVLRGKMHGYGMYRWPGGMYQGGFRCNKLYGKGRFVDAEGFTWIGSFKGDSALQLKLDLEILSDF